MEAKEYINPDSYNAPELQIIEVELSRGIFGDFQSLEPGEDQPLD